MSIISGNFPPRARRTAKHQARFFSYHLSKENCMSNHSNLGVQTSSLRLTSLKLIAHWVRNVHVRFSVFFFIFLFLSYQNACYGCENSENRTWSEFFSDGRKFRMRCVNVIDTTWGCFYFLTFENFGLSVQRPLILNLSHFNSYCSRVYFIRSIYKYKLSSDELYLSHTQLYRV